MTWARDSKRHKELPGNWNSLRLLALRRDGHRCTAVDDGVRCSRAADEVDHIVPGNDHRLVNLASMCHDHHALKTRREAQVARRSRKRPQPPHPGLL